MVRYILHMIDINLFSNCLLNYDLLLIHIYVIHLKDLLNQVLNQIMEVCDLIKQEPLNSFLTKILMNLKEF